MLEFCKNLVLPDMDVSHVCKTVVHEDNQGCLKLASLEPGRMTPRSKFYAVKYHWFRSKILPNRIEIVYVPTLAGTTRRPTYEGPTGSIVSR